MSEPRRFTPDEMERIAGMHEASTVPPMNLTRDDVFQLFDAGEHQRTGISFSEVNAAMLRQAAADARRSCATCQHWEPSVLMRRRFFCNRRESPCLYQDTPADFSCSLWQAAPPAEPRR